MEMQTRLRSPRLEEWSLGMRTGKGWRGTQEEQKGGWGGAVTAMTGSSWLDSTGFSGAGGLERRDDVKAAMEVEGMRTGGLQIKQDVFPKNLKSAVVCLSQIEVSEGPMEMAAVRMNSAGWQTSPHAKGLVLASQEAGLWVTAED
jgi:hypothetical protein